MSKLQELIQKLCPDRVEYSSLGKYIDIYTGIQFNKKDMSEVGTYPVLNGGVNPSGFTEKFNEQENTITISQGGASAGYVNWMKCKFWAGAHCFIVKPNINILNNRYLYFLLKNSEQRLMQSKHGAGIPGLNRDKIRNLIIPIPPLAVQEEIARILDHFTNIAAELQAELQARKKQYEYYRNRLFDLKTEIGIYKLSDICTVIGDGLHGTPNYKENGNYFFINGNNLIRGKITLSNQTKRIGYEEFCKYSFKFNSNTVFLSINGTIGNVALYNNEQIALGKSVAYFVVNPLFLNVKFLYHYFQSKHARIYFESNSTGSTIKNLGLKALRNMVISVPSLAEQERIVSILDKFEALVNNLSQGLPAEIAAVQEQYEYYRNKLLLFPKNKVSA